jgi:serine protease inhibitor
MSVMQTCGRVFLFLVMVAVVLVQATRNRRDEPQPPKPNVPVAPAFYAPSSDRSTLVAVDNPMQIEKAKTAATAINAFGFKLLAGVVAGQQHENVFLSPLSVFTALTMTENGAVGQTRAAMRHALSVPAAMSEDTLHEAASALLKELRSQKGIDLSIANALWSDMKLPLAPSFVQRCQHLYDADATTLDFNKPAAVDTINGWVKEKTRGKISSIVTPELVRASQAILTNAVYFRGTWLYQFSKS